VSNISKYLNACRDRYLLRLSDAVESARLDGTLVDWEVARVNDSDEVVKVGCPPTGLRIDLLLEIDGSFQPVRVMPETVQDLVPLNHRFVGGLEIFARCSRWDAMQVRVVSPHMVVKEIGAWFDLWFKEEDESEVFPRLCVHYMSDVQARERVFSFDVDLGTAPIIALEGLFESLAEAGGQKVFLY